MRNVVGTKLSPASDEMRPCLVEFTEGTAQTKSRCCSSEFWRDGEYAGVKSRCDCSRDEEGSWIERVVSPLRQQWVLKDTRLTFSMVTWEPIFVLMTPCRRSPTVSKAPSRLKTVTRPCSLNCKRLEDLSWTSSEMPKTLIVGVGVGMIHADRDEYQVLELGISFSFFYLFWLSPFLPLLCLPTEGIRRFKVRRG